MSNEEYVSFPPEKIALQREGNFTSYLILPFAYLHKKGLSGEDYAKFVGELFAPAWGASKGKPLKEIAETYAMNLVTFGASKVSISGDDTKVKIKVEDWPPKEFLAFFGISEEMVDALWESFEPIAVQLEINYSWKRDENIVTLVLSS